VHELANTRITIMRGTAVNDAGDVSDVGTPVYLHVPAALVEKGHVTTAPRPPPHGADCPPSSAT
jgi:hypothetical protein